MAGDLNHSVLRPHGHAWLMEPGKKPAEADGLCCVHCGAHWFVVRGSGRRRGFCLRCMGPTCGPACSGTCVHRDKALDLYERGVLPDLAPATVAAYADRLPVSAAVPAEVPKGE